MIFIVTQTFAPRIGGMEMVMTALAEKLAATGAPVTVLPDKACNTEAPYRVQHKNRFKCLRAGTKRRWLTRHIAAGDSVICDSWKSVPAVPEGNKRLIVLAHGQEYLKSGRRARRVQKALNRASHLLASSAYTLELVRSGWDISHLKAQVVPPTYMLADRIVTLPPRQTRPVQLVSICRLDARKGLLQTLLALAKLGRDHLPDWCWTIGGDGPQRNELQAAIHHYDISDRVRLAGPVDEATKHDLLCRAALFVMPAYQHGNSIEGFGISYAEAARYGVASIAGTAGGAPEAVLDGQTGWCVDALDNRALENALTSALSSPAERHKRGLAAQAHFQLNFASTKVLQQFLLAIN